MGFPSEDRGRSPSPYHLAQVIISWHDHFIASLLPSVCVCVCECALLLSLPSLTEDDLRGHKRSVVCIVKDYFGLRLLYFILRG